MWPLIFAILFPRTARAFLTLVGVALLIVFLFFSSSYSDWQRGCAAHPNDAAYRYAQNCDGQKDFNQPTELR